MAPPSEVGVPETLLPEKALLVTVTGPAVLLIRMAPPKNGALLKEKVLLFTRRPAPSLRMAPPEMDTELPEMMQLVTITVPLLKMAPPRLEDPLAMVSFSTVNVMPTVTENTPTVPPPLMVITLPPSMVVSALMVFVLVTIIVAAPPQSKVTVPSKRPPPGRQAFSAVSVQLALVPVPTTHARADEVAANTAKTSKGRTSTSRVRTVVAFIACLPC